MRKSNVTVFYNVTAMWFFELSIDDSPFRIKLYFTTQKKQQHSSKYQHQ